MAAASAESCSQVMPFEASLSALMPERVLLARVGWVKHRTHKYLSGNPSSPPGWHRRFQKGFKWEPRRQHIDLIQVKWHSPLGEILSFRSKVTGSECLTKRHDEANQYALHNPAGLLPAQRAGNRRDQAGRKGSTDAGFCRLKGFLCLGSCKISRYSFPH